MIASSPKLCVAAKESSRRKVLSGWQEEAEIVCTVLSYRPSRQHAARVRVASGALAIRKVTSVFLNIAEELTVAKA